MRVSLIAVATVVMLSSAATAQQMPQQMMWQQSPMAFQGMMTYGMMPMMGMMNLGQHVEGRLAYLKAELAITDAQMPQWNSYADALRENGERVTQVMSDMMARGGMSHGMMMGEPGMMMPGQYASTTTLLDRLSWAEQSVAAHMEMLRKIKAPIEQLYAVLTAEQRRVADQLMASMGMM